MAKKHKELNFELNLVPFIDMLSTCICFLLISVTWVQLGTMRVKQSVGGQPSDEKPKPTYSADIEPNGDLVFEIKDPGAGTKSSHVVIANLNGEPDLGQLQNQLATLKSQNPEINMALVNPKASISYDNVVKVMDVFRSGGIVDLGITPL